jgi:hypothetical protein
MDDEQLVVLLVALQRGFDFVGRIHEPDFQPIPIDEAIDEARALLARVYATPPLSQPDTIQ